MNAKLVTCMITNANCMSNFYNFCFAPCMAAMVSLVALLSTLVHLVWLLLQQFQVGCPKIVPRIRTCAKFQFKVPTNKSARMHEFSLQFLDNQTAVGTLKLATMTTWGTTQVQCGQYWCTITHYNIPLNCTYSQFLQMHCLVISWFAAWLSSCCRFSLPSRAHAVYYGTRDRESDHWARWPAG